jgi:transposase, IS6 family
MSDFKWRHFAGDIILHCVRWYCKYGISYRDLEEMMRERGIAVDHTTLYRWVQAYAPEIEKRLRWYRNGRDLDGSWRVDETYIRVKGQWKYLYRAVNAPGWNQPHTITADKNPAYGAAIAKINAERTEEAAINHRTAKYLNNIIEADRGKLKRRIKPTLGFKSMKTAYATLKGFEVMHMFRKRQFNVWFPGAAGVTGEIRLINRLFGIDAT